MSWLKDWFSKKQRKQASEVDEKFRKPLNEKQPAQPEEVPKAKWQAVYDAAASLHIFKEVNERYLQGDAYQKLLELLSDKYHQLDRLIDTNPKWEESPRALCITGKYYAWTFHDESITDTIEMKFERLRKDEWDEPEGWSVESDWPCTGQYQYLSEHKDTGNHWNYDRMTHNAWLLKEPFGLPGVWSFEYKTTNSKG